MDKIAKQFNDGVSFSMQAHAARAKGLVEDSESLDRSALAAFEEALRLNPDHLGALAGKGMSLASHGEPVAAAKTFLEAYRRDPSNYENLRQLGLCHIELRNLPAARDATKRAVAQAANPEYAKNAAIEVYNFGGYIMQSAATQRDAGNSAEAHGSYEAARQVFSLSMEISPSEHARQALEIVAKLLGVGWPPN